ncbi:hypothetical protein ABK040_016175 [Willaertia magna]
MFKRHFPTILFSVLLFIVTLSFQVITTVQSNNHNNYNNNPNDHHIVQPISYSDLLNSFDNELSSYSFYQSNEIVMLEQQNFTFNYLGRITIKELYQNITKEISKELNKEINDISRSEIKNYLKNNYFSAKLNLQFQNKQFNNLFEERIEVLAINKKTLDFYLIVNGYNVETYPILQKSVNQSTVQTSFFPNDLISNYFPTAFDNKIFLLIFEPNCWANSLQQSKESNLARTNLYKSGIKIFNNDFKRNHFNITNVYKNNNLEEGGIQLRNLESNLCLRFNYNKGYLNNLQADFVNCNINDKNQIFIWTGTFLIIKYENKYYSLKRDFTFGVSFMPYNNKFKYSKMTLQLITKENENIMRGDNSLVVTNNEIEKFYFENDLIIKEDLKLNIYEVYRLLFINNTENSNLKEKMTDEELSDKFGFVWSATVGNSYYLNHLFYLVLVVMKIAIIGAGWYGCHMAQCLEEEGHEIVLFEKNKEIFRGASGYNQFRLHQGLHYPRSFITRKQTLEGFKHFMNKYSHLTTTVDYNLYGVATRGSIVDFGTYKQVMDASGIKNKLFDHRHFGLDNLEGSVLCEERVLYYDYPREYFGKRLSHCLRLNTPVTSLDELDDASDHIKVNNEVFDWCINCTYNTFSNTPNLQQFYEPCITLLYKDIRSNPYPRVAMTVMDGKFVSLFPYIANPEDEQSGQVKYTLTHVEHTPLGQYNTFKEAEKRRLDVENDFEGQVLPRIPLFESGILHHYPSFKEHFQYFGFFTSMKTKTYGVSDARECTVETEGRLISVMSGKVNSLHVAEDVVKGIIYGKKEEEH